MFLNTHNICVDQMLLQTHFLEVELTSSLCSTQPVHKAKLCADPNGAMHYRLPADNYREIDIRLAILQKNRE